MEKLFKNSWKKAALFLKEGQIGVIPTDTIYGICTSAFKERAVKKIYKLRKRSPKKPTIILISSLDDLKKFGVKLNSWQRKIISIIWPGKISIVLNCSLSRFAFLHRGKGTLAFRLPKEKGILKILKISGPLVAPSANWEGKEPAKTIQEAKRYFGKEVFYFDRGKINKEPSTLIDLTKKEIKILRKGADFSKIKKILK